jgi:hypothetical protein
MPIEISERVVFINRIHLFNGLNQEQFEAVAKELTEETIPAGKEIVKQGAEGDCLYLIWSGRVSVTQSGKEQPLATFVAGDYFGEESVLVNRHRRTATVTTTEETLVLVLTREHFRQLLKQAPGLRINFVVTVNSHHLERRIHFKWLQANEVIYFLARKHPILLVRALTLPVIVELVAILGMILTWWYSPDRLDMQALWYVALVAGVLAAGWGIWNGIDWGNDYYIVTDRRVVWLEKVVGIYDSRQEAPLSAIQRVNVTTELSGRILDYGNLVVRTIVGSTLILNSVNHPYQAAALIEEHWKRSQETSRNMEEEDMRQALRARLLPGQSKPAPIAGIIAKPPAKKKDTFRGHRRIANLFRLRFEDMAIVTYRKHIFVLFQQTWQPGLILWILLGVLVFELATPSFSFQKNILSNMTGEALSILWVLLFIGAIAWWIYQYIDWSNDIFQVTPDQIMDINKTPLGEVVSDIASLDNILSIEHERRGLLELLFNYGDVLITVGGGKQMTFENVFNPSAVQEDIERRRLERTTKKEQERVKAERERMADWFAAYYHNEQRFRSDEGAPGEKKPEDNKPEVK